MIRISIRTNTRQLIRVLNKKLKKLDKDSEEAINTTAEYGKHLARNLAPKKTKMTMRAIKWVKGKKDKRAATVVAGSGHPNKTWKGEKFNLTYWLHYSGRAPSHIRTGEPRFLFVAGDIMKKRLNRNFRKVISAFTKR